MDFKEYVSASDVKCSSSKIAFYVVKRFMIKDFAYDNARIGWKRLKKKLETTSERGKSVQTELVEQK
jgi:hypothetical protein